MTDMRIPDALADRVAEAVRHALRLVGQPENGVERETEPEEERAVS